MAKSRRIRETQKEGKTDTQRDRDKAREPWRTAILQVFRSSMLTNWRDHKEVFVEFVSGVGHLVAETTRFWRVNFPASW